MHNCLLYFLFTNVNISATYLVYNRKHLFVYICNVKKINLQKIEEWYRLHKEEALAGRWIPLATIEPIINALDSSIFNVKELGFSSQNRPIYKVSLGHGKRHILIWSQMHGNESTGTKAVFDFFRFIKEPGEFSDLVQQLLEKCTITVIPMLNPDGAQVYTRVNADNIDLNRDVIDRKAPESDILHKVLNEVQPEYCFNLHDQRTIFTVGNTKQTATLSFLAPSIDVSREVTEGRKKTMRVIAAINETMQELIPGRVGRYTDEFYPTATGDNFEKAGHHTILIEAGHQIDDYEREHVRYYNFIALLQGITYLASDIEFSHESYFDIPNNTKFFVDVIYTNIFIESEQKTTSVATVFKEELKDGELHFIEEIQDIEDLDLYAANTIVDKKGIRTANLETLKKNINS